MSFDWPYWPDVPDDEGKQWVWAMRLAGFDRMLDVPADWPSNRAVWDAPALRAVLDRGFLPLLRRWDECR